MAKARLAVFCHPEELTAWLRVLSSAQRLACLAFRDDRDSGEIHSDCTALTIDDQTTRVFLMPEDRRPARAPSLSDASPRDLGWLDVAPGKLVTAADRRILTYSTVTGEDYPHEPVHPSRFVQWLRRRIKPEVKAGVIARNVVHGGEAVYRNIWHTERARALPREGVVWKQFVTGNVEYEPLST